MNKLLTASLLIAGLSNTTQAASIDEAFKNASTSGQLRFGYISLSPDAAGSQTTTGAAIGGELKFETAKWNNFQLAFAPYFSENIDILSGDTTTGKLNTDFLSRRGTSFAYLAEAYVHYEFNNGFIRLGRQKLDNPFINTDDIRMFSNTFSAGWLNVNLSKSLTLEAGHVNTWAGFDSEKDLFSKASDEGVSALGLNYKHSENLSTQGWYYHFDQNYSLLYADMSYSMGKLELAAQFGSYSEDNSSGTDGSVVGASITYSIGPFTLSAVMNSGSNDDGKSADLGLGGGNYYAAMDESTISGLNDAEAYVLSVEYAASDSFTAAVAAGHFENNDQSTRIDETNLILGYSVSDSLNLELIHTTVDDAGSANDFSRQTARVTYSF
ncbi:MAG: OprD family outer membrane porin [Gammaproteobacteria bacterium]|nr:OprD family outer membrane porin [Gammaproteobacteria bacterium]